MNYGNNEEGENRKHMSGLPKLAALIVLTAAFAAASAALGMMLPVFVAAASTSYIVCRGRSPLGAVFAVLLSFGAVLFITTDIASASQTVSFIVLCGLAILFLRRRSAGAFPSCLLLGGICAAVIAAFFLIAIHKEYGNIIEGTSKYFADMYSAFKARVTAIGAAGTEASLISENVIDEAASLLSSMIPGIAALLIQFLGVEAFIAYRVFYRIASKGEDDGAAKGAAMVPRSVPVFLLVSFLIALVFSIGKKTELIYMAAVNMVIALSLPTFADGLRRFIGRIRRPSVIMTPTGPVRRRPPFFLIGLLVVFAFLNPLMPVVMIMTYSVVGTIADIVKERKKKEEL